jgi:hypothetical protein
MKNILILLLLILSACEPDEQEQDIVYADRTMRYFRTDKDVRKPKAGVWRGELHFVIPDKYDVTAHAIREVRYLSDSTFDMRWWSYPDTSVTVNVTDTLRYVMPLHWHNTSCGVQDTWHIYDVTGIFRNDTLFETGTLEYKFYYYGELKQHFFGTFTAYSMFERKLRP